MKITYNYRFLKLISVFVLVFTTSCSITERVSYEDSEGAIPKDVLKKIKSKKAEKSWVLANLGAPYSVDKIRSSHMTPELDYEVYNYRFAKSHIRSGQLLFLLRAGGSEESVEYFHVAFQGDLIDRAWTDKLPRAELGERVVKMRKKVAKMDAPTVTPNAVDNESRFAWKLPILKKWFSKPAKERKDDVAGSEDMVAPQMPQKKEKMEMNEMTDQSQMVEKPEQMEAAAMNKTAAQDMEK